MTGTEIESYYAPGEFTVYALEAHGRNPIDATYRAVYCGEYIPGTEQMPDVYLRSLVRGFTDGNQSVQWIPPLAVTVTLPDMTLVYTVRLDWHEGESLEQIEDRGTLRRQLRSV